MLLPMMVPTTTAAALHVPSSRASRASPVTAADCVEIVMSSAVSCAVYRASLVWI
jgi:hypothetical protein